MTHAPLCYRVPVVPPRNLGEKHPLRAADSLVHTHYILCRHTEPAHTAYKHTYTLPDRAHTSAMHSVVIGKQHSNPNLLKFNQLLSGPYSTLPQFYENPAVTF